ncbi:glycosyltransferase family 1 protein [soil metagenome]
MSTRPKIFLEAHNINNEFSGFGQFNYWLIKNLVGESKDFEYIVNAKDKKSLRDLKGDVSFNRYFSYTRYPAMRTRKKYDLWHSLNQNSKIEPYYNMPYVLTLHDVIFLEKDPIEQVDKKKIQLLKEKIERSSYIIYISNHARTSANQHFNIPNDLPQKVIYNGNPVEQVSSVTAPNLSFNLEMPFLFCIGQFLEMKNFHSLVGMLSKLKDYQLVIAGNNDKPYRDVVMMEIEKYNLEKRVHLVGKISDLEKHFYLQNCTAFVFPSLFEGFGLPPIEAMTYGKPVFLANRTSLPEIGGAYAFYWDQFDPEYMSAVFLEGMERYWENSDIYKKELVKRATSFSWKSTAGEYLKVYSEILNH